MCSMFNFHSSLTWSFSTVCLPRPPPPHFLTPSLSMHAFLGKGAFHCFFSLAHSHLPPLSRAIRYSRGLDTECRHTQRPRPRDALALPSPMLMAHAFSSPIPTPTCHLFLIAHAHAHLLPSPWTPTPFSSSPRMPTPTFISPHQHDMESHIDHRPRFHLRLCLCTCSGC
jgi:hypothetical protein